MKERNLGTYSIHYDGWESGDDAYVAYAIDWSWKIQSQWARSDNNGPGTPWHTTQGLNNKAYQALLKHFGLEQWEAEFPLEEAITLSPAKLAVARREKERLYGFEKKEILNHTLGYGYNHPAEEYE